MTSVRSSLLNHTQEQKLNNLLKFWGCRVRGLRSVSIIVFRGQQFLFTC